MLIRNVLYVCGNRKEAFNGIFMDDTGNLQQFFCYVQKKTKNKKTCRINKKNIICTSGFCFNFPVSFLFSRIFVATTTFYKKNK